MKPVQRSKKRHKRKKQKKDNLLLEILCEELPPGVQTKASEELAQSVLSRLDDARLPHGRCEMFSTPRRLAVLIRDVGTQAADLQTSRRGPRVEAAFRDGRPTPAGLGFAKSTGLALEKLGRIHTEKGVFLEAKILEKGLSLKQAMGTWLLEGLAKIHFPKVMRWDDGKGLFSRPVRGLMMVYGGKALIPAGGGAPFGLRIGARTRGPRYEGSRTLVIHKALDYAKSLRRAGVLVDPLQRRKALEHALLKAGSKIKGARMRRDEDLLRMVTRDVEGVCVLLGTFDKDFLELPEEVIVTAMKEHQKYFAVEDSNGRLLPYFVAVLALKSPDPSTRAGRSLRVSPRSDDAQGAPDLPRGLYARVRKGHEKVLRARLADAQFYMAEDLKTSMDEKVSGLDQIVFVRGLGSLADRVGRLVVVADWLSKKIFSDTDSSRAQTVRQIARWSKADLVTDMIKDGKEFTKLQGTIGRIYAQKQGVDDKVAMGIEAHYRPRHPGDAPPTDLESCVVALADKADHITAGFLSGKIPTGSSDPYGLRRHAMGILVLIRKRLPNYSIRLRELFGVCRKAYPGTEDKGSGDGLENRISDFVEERLAIQLREEGISHDSLEAIRTTQEDDVVQFEAKARALESWRLNPQTLEARTALLRVLKILPPEPDPSQAEINPEIFSHPAEGKLLAAVEAVDPLVRDAEHEGRYEEAWNALASLQKPIDEYFEEVMVMSEDEKLRRNRLALLTEIRILAKPLGDLTKLTGGT